MEIAATLHFDSLSVPVNLRADHGLITITRPDGSIQAFEGRPRLTWRDSWYTCIQLSFTRGKPLRCTFDCVSIETNPGGERLVIDPGSPYDELLTIDARGDEASVITEWNKGKLQWLHGKSVRCTADGNSFSILEAETSSLILTVRWDSVRAIRVYKRDLFSYDMICLGFQVIDKSWVELWEESETVASLQSGYSVLARCNVAVA